MKHLYFNANNNQLVSAFKDSDGYHLVNSLGPAQDALVLTQVGGTLSNTRVIIIDSSNSGVGRQNRDIYGPVLKPILEEWKVSHQYILTESSDTAQQVASQLLPGNYTVIFISGDTTVNEFINGLTPTTGGSEGGGDLFVFPIPFGTGNSLALSLEIGDEFEAIRKLLTGSPHRQQQAPKLNVYNALLPQETWLLHQDQKVKLMPPSVNFLIVLSWGFHAALVADSDTPEYRKFGIDRFKMAAMKNLQTAQEYNGTTTITPQSPGSPTKSGEYNGPFAYWLVTGSNKFEPTFEILPHGDIYDDNLYFVGFKTNYDNPSYIMDIMTKVYNHGQHIRDPTVSYEKISPHQVVNLRFDGLPKDKRRFCLDGSILLLPESGVISMQAAGNAIGLWNFYLL